MTLHEIIAQLPSLTIAERRALRAAVERSLTGIDTESPRRPANSVTRHDSATPRRRTRLSQKEIEARLRIAEDFGDLDGLLELAEGQPLSDDEVAAIIEEERLRKYG